MSACDLERVEAYLVGELTADACRTTAAHLRTCDACSNELRLLRRERQALVGRGRSQPALPDFSQVMAALDAPVAPVRPAASRWLLAGLTAAALLLLLPRVPAPVPVEASGGACFAIEAAPTIELAEASEELRFGACLLASPVASSHCL